MFQASGTGPEWDITGRGDSRAKKRVYPDRTAPGGMVTWHSGQRRLDLDWTAGNRQEESGARNGPVLK
ncbi:hypothetical protein AAFF_G00325660 [Aldrovandia affinis]|uniref:Uncharacterized protein n=1 Tax=Aldrovandia affinis TaxID=143900 RepID=A0AAD7TAC0_9TELE|nr:hypothetical protein AAFF_G00325660 [Aldrovandia affinis]